MFGKLSVFHPKDMDDRITGNIRFGFEMHVYPDEITISTGTLDVTMHFRKPFHATFEVGYETFLAIWYMWGVFNMSLGNALLSEAGDVEIDFHDFHAADRLFEIGSFQGFLGS